MVGRARAGAAAGAGARASRPLIDLLAILAAVAASVALAYLLTGSAVLALAFGAGLVALGLMAFVGARYRAPASTLAQGPEIDWAITLAALEQAGLAVAITDRANRLVCASAAYREWFDTAAPPRLDLGEAASDVLAHLARTAWREGTSGEPQAMADNAQVWSIDARTAGSAEDYLVWLFTPVHPVEAVETIDAQVTGPLGRMLGQAGIAAALVGPGGTIRAANPAFALGAGGDEAAELAGRGLRGPAAYRRA